MENVFILLFLVSLLMMVIGFFSPGTSMFWDKKSPTKGKSAAIYGTAMLVFFVAFGSMHDESKTKVASKIEHKEEEEVEKEIGVGQILHTTYFDIKVNKMTFKDNVNTGSEFSDIKSEKGVKFLVMNVTIKNIDKESRMVSDGSVWINYNGKDYEFDKTEVVLLEGWGLLLDQLNPLISKTTNLVYKIPDEVKGKAYWQPGRADSDERIFLGELK